MTDLSKSKTAFRTQNGSDEPLLRDIAYERLKDAIREGELQPGEPLSETRLSAALQISRTPVREALHQLAQEGLVRNLPNRAMTVAAPSLQDVLNILHIRSLTDPEIARLVTESVTAETLTTLNGALKEMYEAVEEGDRTLWSRADTVYHETLTEACPNALLGQLGLQMRNRMHYLATDSQTTSSRLKDCTDEHQAVVTAIGDHDPMAAREAMASHIDNLRASFFKRLAHT